MVGQCFVQLSKVGHCYVQLSNGWIVLCPIFQWLDSVVYSCPMVKQWRVQLSNGWTVLTVCPTVQLFELSCVELSNGWTVLCWTVQWSDSAVSNVLMVGQCCVQLSNEWTVLCPKKRKANVNLRIFVEKYSNHLRAFCWTNPVWKILLLDSFKTLWPLAISSTNIPDPALCLTIAKTSLAKVWRLSKSGRSFEFGVSIKVHAV